MNRLLLLLFGMVTFVAHAQVPDYVPTEGLVAWYPFNGNANDESGNAANGTIHGATPTEDRNGVSSAAFHFDGQSWVSASPLGLPDANTPRSVSAWLNPSTVAGSFTLTAVAYGAPSSSSAFMVGLYNQGIAVQGWADDFGTEVDYNADEWMQVVCTYAASSIKIYLNGVLIEEGENTTWNTMDGPLILGSRVDLANSYFEGSIDDVGIWNRALDPTEVVALYNSVTSVPGCTDLTACNYTEDANEDDGTCTYPPFGLADCEAGSELCGEGTIWDASLQACVGFNDCPSDLDGDGLIGVEDLLSLLSDFGTDCVVSDDPVTAEFTCGDPVSYHGYDYATVQIGEQCWFAENLRAESYADGSALDPAQYAAFDNAPANIDSYGLLYKGAAVTDPLNLCPTDWHISTLPEWQLLEAHATANGHAGSEAAALKSTSGWSTTGNGSDAFGFNATPGGFHYNPIHPYWGEFAHSLTSGYWWTTTPHSTGRSYAWTIQDIVSSPDYPHSNGLSVRCIKD